MPQHTERRTKEIARFVHTPCRKIPLGFQGPLSSSAAPIAATRTAWLVLPVEQGRVSRHPTGWACSTAPRPTCQPAFVFCELHPIGVTYLETHSACEPLAAHIVTDAVRAHVLGDKPGRATISFPQFAHVFLSAVDGEPKDVRYKTPAPAR